MSKRFEAEYSPKSKSDRGDPSLDSKKLSRLRKLGIFAYPLAAAGGLAILSGNPLQGAIGIAASFAVAGSLLLTKEGLKAEAAFHTRVISRAPAIPRKALGAIGIGLTVWIANWLGVGTPFFSSLGLGALAMAGMFASFGLDPLRSKGLSGINSYEASRAAEAIEKAEALLQEIKEMAHAITDRYLNLEVENLAISAEDMFHQIENNPGEYRNARRYLSVYLKGARDATSQFLNLPSNQQSGEAKDKYTMLIRELDAGFRQKSQLLLEDKRAELDIEIDVLRDRLAAEGVTISKEETL